MSFVPSTRECLQRLDRMRDTAQLIASVEQLNTEIEELDAELGIQRSGPELRLATASRRMAELHQLCLHLAANLSGGLGVPPTPAVKTNATVEQAGSKPHTATWSRLPAGKSAPATARPSPPSPEGMVSVTEFAQRLRVSRSYFYSQVHKGDVPKPNQGGGVPGRPAFWHEAVVAAVVASRVK